MKKFNILPTDSSFKNLTYEQINLLIYMHNQNTKDETAAKKGTVTEEFDSGAEYNKWLEEEKGKLSSEKGKWNEL